MNTTGIANYGALRSLRGGVFSARRTSSGLVETIKNMREEVNIKGSVEIAKDIIQTNDLDKDMRYVSKIARLRHPPLIGDSRQIGLAIDTYA